MRRLVAAWAVLGGGGGSVGAEVQQLVVALEAQMASVRELHTQGAGAAALVSLMHK